MIRDLSLTCDLCGRTVRHICENGVVAETIEQQIIRSLKVERDALKAEVERLTEALADRDICDACSGTGQWVDYPAVQCPKCHGCTRCARGESDE